VTFSAFSWTCPNFGSLHGVLPCVFLIALGALFVAGALSPSATIGPRFGRPPRSPVPLHFRVIFGLVGAITIYVAIRSLLLC